MSQLSNPPDRPSDRKTHLILGCGYVGERIARIWRSNGDRVLAVTRTSHRAGELEKLGLEPIVWNWLEALEDHQPPSDTLGESSLSTVLIAVSHAAAAHTPGLEKLANALSENTRTGQARWIYLSTTGVFADPHSDTDLWVDESSSVGPTRPGSINALEAERWLEHSGLEHVVLRPAGIYGPGRIPNIQPIRDGQPMQVDPESYLNLIHVEDLASIIQAVAQGPLRHRLYCISDGSSVQRKDYYSFLAQSMRWPEPCYCAPAYCDPASARRRNQGNKRVSNRRLMDDYSIQFRFPDYRSGLGSLLEEMAR